MIGWVCVQSWPEGDGRERIRSHMERDLSFNKKNVKNNMMMQVHILALQGDSQKVIHTSGVILREP